MIMKLQIQIKGVVVAKELYSFIAVQIEYQDTTTPTQKYRTDLSTLTNRPKYQNNLFTFHHLIERQKLRFGLMACQDSSSSSIQKGTLQGIASFAISLQRLKSLAPEGLSQTLKFAAKGKQIGQFECLIRCYHSKDQSTESNKGKVSSGGEFLSYNPLISRILYSEEVAKDELRLYNHIKQLQKQNASIFKNFTQLKNQQDYFETIYTNLLKDQQQLKNEIEINQKINEKIAIKINQRQSIQSLKLQIDMLVTTEEGKRLLMQKSDYLEERIGMESVEYGKLTDRYNSIRDEIDKRIQRMEDYRNKLKGKEIQQFQLNKNQSILQTYENIEYEYKCNQQIIHNLVKKSKSSEMSAEQAALILSQVQFQIKLQSMSNEFQGQSSKQKMLELIQREAKISDKNESENLGEEQKFVLEIKLNALNQEIDQVKSKIRQIMLHNRLAQSNVRKF